GPLTAAVEAQALAAKTSWDFINKVGMNTDEKGNKEAINVQFSYISGGKLTKLNVPLLTILPIPYIIIDSISIDFKAKITASADTSAAKTAAETKDTSKSFDASVKAGAKWGWGSASLKANTEMKAGFSSKKDSSESSNSKYAVEYTLDVSVRAGQPEMPAGMATVLNILQDSIKGANPTVRDFTIKNTGTKAAPAYEITWTVYDSRGKKAKADSLTALANGTPGNPTAPTDANNPYKLVLEGESAKGLEELTIDITGKLGEEEVSASEILALP
ncbi:MAG TPA: hypothetical protein DCP28_15295, partial [Cytophagales bacterium]|nr:hypothetical protein [Cytophagales bacterium]